MSPAGTALLCASLAAALAAAVLWTLRARSPGVGRRMRRVVRAAQVASGVSLASALGAVVLMEIALLAGGGPLDYPATVTDPGVPAYYRFTALWSAMEGSLMLWLLILAAVAGLFTLRRIAADDEPGAQAVLWLVVAAFGVVVLVAHPFSVTGEPTAGPSPLLQDHPAMGIHPPLLYLGFAGLSVPFALSLTTAGTDPSQGWASRVHAWTLGAWIPLTAGILLGAWWSYAVLGWGGYWAWDPVENASLMPWLLATALLHAVGPRTRAPGWRRWSVWLAGGAFSLVLLATFLTRSGVVASIHAFSTSPLGPLLLSIFAVALVAWISCSLRAGALLADAASAPLVSRETAVLMNRVLLVLVTGIVLVGSLLPTVIAAVTDDQVSVGSPWYARTIGPLALLLLVIMAVVPLLPGRGGPGGRPQHAATVPLIVGGGVVTVVAFTTRDPGVSIVAGLAGIVFTTLAMTLRDSRRRNSTTVGALLTHLGVVVGAVAVVAGSQATSVEQTVPIGGSVATAGASATLVTVDRIDDGHRSIAEAQVLLGNGTRALGMVNPQLRWYERQGAVLAGPAIRTEPFRDIYVTLLNVDPVEGSAQLRLTVTPMISWLWVAGGLMVGGAGLAALGGRRVPRRRPGTPARAATVEAVRP